jgi:hypothetical protein
MALFNLPGLVIFFGSMLLGYEALGSMALACLAMTVADLGYRAARQLGNNWQERLLTGQFGGEVCTIPIWAAGAVCVVVSLVSNL